MFAQKTGVIMIASMGRPKRKHGPATQIGWRLDSRDKDILKHLDEYSFAHRLSRNSAITIAVERMIKEWQDSMVDKK